MKYLKDRTIRINTKAAVCVFAGLAVLGALFYLRGLFIAAIIDGAPMSRLSVIQELETVSGRQALDALIVRRLVAAEAKRRGISINTEDVNAEIRRIEERISRQGRTLEMMLAQQNMAPDRFREEIRWQKKLEKLLENNIQVTDEEISRYFEENKIVPPAGVAETEIKDQIREQLKNQKFGMEADTLIAELKAKAAIRYYVWYGNPPSVLNPVPTATSSNAQNE